MEHYPPVEHLSGTLKPLKTRTVKWVFHETCNKGLTEHPNQTNNYMQNQ